MSEMIVAVFDTPAEADAAVRDVEAAGPPAAVVRRYTNDDPELRDYQAARQPQSFWSWLFGEDTSASEYQVYDRSLAEGGIVVTVTVGEDQAPRVMDILNRHRPIDLEERAANYGFASATSGTAGVASRMGTSSYDAETGPAGPTPARTSAVNTQEEVIPLREEQLEVGKRAVDRGTTRLRRYVVRTPVEESVTLREERVTIERRRPVAPGTPGVPEGAFEERIIEVHATGEEPVVSKAAHVAEEVVVRKDATERTETVRDTVQREQVAVEKDGEPPTDLSRPAKP